MKLFYHKVLRGFPNLITDFNIKVPTIHEDGDYVHSM